MKGHLFWFVVWLGVLLAGYFLSDRLLTAPPPVARSVTGGDREIEIPAARDGHFYLEGSVNGSPIRFMVDTGASYVAVNAAFARSAGLEGGVTGYFSTANGSVEGRIVGNQTVNAGGFEVSGLSVAVMPAAGAEGLLGQNFLRHFEVAQAGGVLRLRWRNPVQ